MYGAAADDAVYAMDGIYNFADSGETRYARLYFRDSLLRQVFGFTGEDETGSPREIIPQTGDRFTIVDQWLDLDNNGNVIGSSTSTGETLVFGSDSFRWEEVYAAPGDYVIGFIVEDMDGNSTLVYTRIVVE